MLARVGETEKKIGESEKEFVNKANECFVTPLKNFLDGQMRTIQVSN
jgi:hypothetical protein